MKGRAARRLSSKFLRGVLEHLRALKTIYDPVKKITLEVEYDEEALLTGNHQARIKKRMEELGIYDKERLKSIPLEGFVRYTAEQRGFLRRVGAVIIHAAVVTDTEAFIKEGEASEPVDATGAEEAFMRVHKIDTGLYHYVGLFSPTGFTDDIKESLPVRETAALALIEKGEGTRWDVFVPDVAWKKEFGRLFDVETERERRHRVAEALRDCPDISYAGGHIEIEQIAEQEGVAFELAKQEAEKLARQSEDLLLEQIDGVWVLRRRFL